VRDFCVREVKPHAMEWDREEKFPREVVAQLGELGLLGMAVPEDLGGSHLDTVSIAMVVEEIARWDGSLALTVASHNGLGTSHILRFGSEELRRRFIPDIASGKKLAAWGLTEPGSGSDAAALRTTAQRDGSDYILNGTKAWISHAGQADFYTVFARTSGNPDGRDRARGISCFHVPAQTPGVKPAEPEHKMGMRSSVTAQVLFESAAVPADQMVGDQDRGFSIALSALDSGRLGIAACSVGVAQAALDAATAYARERRQFGRPIIEFQGLSFMLADMATAVAAARALYLAAARRKDAGLPFGQQAAMAKLFASDTAMKVTTDAVQVLGGYGYVPTTRSSGCSAMRRSRRSTKARSRSSGS